MILVTILTKKSAGNYHRSRHIVPPPRCFKGVCFMGSLPVRIRTLAIMACALSLAACRGMSGVASSSGLPAVDVSPVQAGIERILPDGAHKIQHVVIII